MSLGGGSSVGSGDDGGSVGSTAWALSISTTVLFVDAPSSDISPCRPRCSRRPPQHHHDYQQVAASSTSSVGTAHATTRLVSTALFVATARAPATSGRCSGRRRHPSQGAPWWEPRRLPTGWPRARPPYSAAHPHAANATLESSARFEGWYGRGPAAMPHATDQAGVSPLGVQTAPSPPVPKAPPRGVVEGQQKWAAAAAATAACTCWATLSRRRAGGKWEGSFLFRG